MKAIEQHVNVLLWYCLFRCTNWFECVTIQMKAVEKYFDHVFLAFCKSESYLIYNPGFLNEDRLSGKHLAARENF